MADTIEKMGHSLIQHGRENNRIYLMKLCPDDLPDLIAQLDACAAQHAYSKIFAKVPTPALPHFLDNGYVVEARIPRFFQGRTEAAFLGKFIDPSRAKSACRAEMDRVLSLASAPREAMSALPLTCRIRLAEERDVVALAALYNSVFDSYPFPIHDPGYLLNTMRSHVCYFVVEDAGEIVAVSSGEMDRENENAEMTDFATRPSHRRKGLATHLLKTMEPEMQRRGIQTLFTIARACSPGMNITFSRCGYIFGGTLINNTQIAGRIESMNIWYRHIA